ncbi:hypothetical protein [Bacillus thuringiensis]|uniref:hypothetical protein n=1 Tax=Bacillus thuringiensis TaxID=1428 RepID=UPI002248F22B|nr:hypothetical protein [Bacillus thuringiensis]
MLFYDKANPHTINSAVCFVDILGFSQLVQESFDGGRGNELLKRLHQTVTNNINELRPQEEYLGVLKAFTDNIVIGRPIYEDGESQLGSIFLEFAAYQLSLTLEGFFVRGAVSVGEYYGDDEFAFGPALLESYHLESKEAINPRIILSNAVVDLVKEHVGYYAEGWAPQIRDLLKDNSDGKYFINYLEAAMGERGPEDYEFAFSILRKHKQIIEMNLNKYKDDTKIHLKYEWVAKYHNYFATFNFNKEHSRELQINSVPDGNISLII